MVNKMNLKRCFLTGLTAVFISQNALADLSTTAIRQRQYVACGISSDYKPLAYKQDNIWQGFDADICRAAALAVLDNAERFKLIPVKRQDIGTALNSGKIDIMLGHPSLNASDEIAQRIIPADTLYFDRLIFASRQTREANSMQDFSGSKVCVLRNSDSLSFLTEYNQKHALGFKPLELPDLQSLKEAFYLKRCDLIIGSEILVKDMVNNLKSQEPAQILPEELAYTQIKAYTSGNSPELNTWVRWIINALKLAHSANITSKNIETFKAVKSPSLQNLLGITPKAWIKMGLEPEWVKDFIPLYGNYWQILERNLGTVSPLQLDIKQNDLIEKGGFISAKPFI